MFIHPPVEMSLQGEYWSTVRILQGEQITFEMLQAGAYTAEVVNTLPPPGKGNSAYSPPECQKGKSSMDKISVYAPYCK